MFSFEELKRRKLVQWAVAYLAGAWVALQLLDVVAEPWGIGTGLLLAAQIVLVFGLPAFRVTRDVPSTTATVAGSPTVRRRSERRPRGRSRPPPRRRPIKFSGARAEPR